MAQFGDTDNEYDSEYKHVYVNGGKWYFYDETYDAHGPFSCRLEAIEKLNEYIHYLNTGELLSV